MLFLYKDNDLIVLDLEIEEIKILMGEKKCNFFFFKVKGIF